MIRCEDNEQSMQQRISSILAHDSLVQRDLGVCNQVEDTEEIEYLLARAEANLREAQAHVDKLRRKFAMPR